MSPVRDVLWFWDPRLRTAAAICVLLLAVDFFSRVALLPPHSSQPGIEEVVALSDTIPQIGQAQLDDYLRDIDSLKKLRMEVDSAQFSNDLAVQQLPREPTDGFWRAGGLSYKLIALVGSTERFAVLYSLDNESGGTELVELRRGDSIVGYKVSEVLSKRLTMTSDTGDQITLTLFEPEESQD